MAEVVAITAAAVVVVVVVTNEYSNQHDTQEPGFTLKPGSFRMSRNVFGNLAGELERKKEPHMDQAILSCPKCQGEMVNGYVIDRSHAFTFVPQWVEGTPTRNSLFESMFTGQGIKQPKSDKWIPIGTFRCQSCGFLEFYAREEFTPT